ncbi:ribosomal-processing cysteine protease Prp [Isobaculum melis]|uniref:Ribosomal processing cysteine protease Prp n=1 Tax=Isobaculum melis TaxID=142588 RepID=A0A1H9RGZ8_9LACT|nr:ribosomal-processing cysteine protease Prp [Isobaculum melis]SER71972.1 hypothetical protein SAMN04488559_10429 [Isobaculum melis]
MIHVSFKHNQDKQIVSFEVSGHAGSGPYGYDLVCAAVSAVTIGTVNSLEKLAQFQPLVEVDEVEGGYLYLEILQDLSEEQLSTTQILLKSLYLTMQDLVKEYPSFIDVKS